MGERLPCKQEVTSSNLVFSTGFERNHEPKCDTYFQSLAFLCTLKTAYEEINDKIKISNQDIRGNVINKH